MNSSCFASTCAHIQRNSCKTLLSEYFEKYIAYWDPSRPKHIFEDNRRIYTASLFLLEHLIAPNYLHLPDIIYAEEISFWKFVFCYAS